MSRNVVVREAGDEDWARLEALWSDFYAQQKTHGMLLDLPDNAYQSWSASLKSGLGRFACLFIAEQADELIGFLAGRIRLLPAYFGGQQTGFISDVFVTADRRGHGHGRQLLAAATNWYKERDISRIELQVVIANTSARDFYLKLGWKEELIQMVWRTEEA